MEVTSAPLGAAAFSAEVGMVEWVLPLKIGYSAFSTLKSNAKTEGPLLTIKKVQLVGSFFLVPAAHARTLRHAQDDMLVATSKIHCTLYIVPCTSTIP